MSLLGSSELAAYHRPSLGACYLRGIEHDVIVVIKRFEELQRALRTFSGPTRRDKLTECAKTIDSVKQAMLRPGERQRSRKLVRTLNQERSAARRQVMVDAPR